MAVSTCSITAPEHSLYYVKAIHHFCLSLLSSSSVFGTEYLTDSRTIWEFSVLCYAPSWVTDKHLGGWQVRSNCLPPTIKMQSKVRPGRCSNDGFFFGTLIYITCSTSALWSACLSWVADILLSMDNEIIMSRFWHRKGHHGDSSRMAYIFSGSSWNVCAYVFTFWVTARKPKYSKNRDE